MTKSQIIFLVSAIILQNASAYKSCPLVCDCFNVIVDCSNNGLNEVPKQLPSWVQELNLSKNPSLKFNNATTLADLQSLRSLALEEMQFTSFPEVGYLPTVEILSMSGNSLASLGPSWSSSFRKLSELDLSKNFFLHLNLTELALELPLQKIDLRSNQISLVFPSENRTFSSLNELRLPRNQIDDDAFRNLSTLFADMPYLKTLDLNRNLIRRPESLKFKHLPNLTVLKLRRNKIENLPDGVFYGLHSLTTLRLDNNSNITEVSNGWLFQQKALRVLSLSHNNIGLIKPNAFETTKNLAILDLNLNRLGCNHNEPSFMTLTNLQELFLSHNCLSTLNQATFGDLIKLRILDLSHNHLQWSIEDDTGAFRSLRSLVSLNLGYNKIETIDGKVFHPLSSLTSLDLSGNPLKTLPQNPFKNMNRLSKLYLISSSLVCDCKLAWFPQWLSTKSFNSVKVSCGFPSDMAGTSLFQLHSKDLSCDVSPLPVISEYPKNQTVLFGNNMTLECIAYSSGEKPSFTWTKGREVVEPFLVKSLMAVEEENEGRSVYKVVSQLLVDNVTHYHAGSYQCVARNTYGPIYSPHFEVIVHRFPYFTQRPISVEIKEGGVVELRCAASGYPQPDMLFNKVGDFPAPREERLLYSSNVYFIKPVLRRDDGLYVCTAENKAGAVNVTARVSVIYTPSFSRPVYNQVTTLGQSIALECQGTGYPKPKVTWYKGDKLIVQDKNHALVDSGQFLLLLKVERADIGPYRCELTNTLGTQRRSVILTLRKDGFMPAVTGLIVMVVVTCVVLTSFVWVIVIYKMRRNRPGRQVAKPQANQNGGIDHSTLNKTSQRRGSHLRGPLSPVEAEEMRTMAPLLNPPPHSQPVEGLHLAPDSGSEHSSGKDSGVAGIGGVGVEESPSVANGDLKGGSRRPSALSYPDSPSGGFHFKGPSLGPVSRSRTSSEVSRPSLSTFGIHHLESGKPGGGGGPHPQTYASLRRGSTSRLLAVPSPVTPAMTVMGINSLPRHAYRSHSNSLYSKPGGPDRPFPDRCSSMSRTRRSSRPDTPPPSSVTDRDDATDFRPPSSAADQRKSCNPSFLSHVNSAPTDQRKPYNPYSFSQPAPAPTYYTFRSSDKKPPPQAANKKGLTNTLPSHLLTTR